MTAPDVSHMWLRLEYSRTPRLGTWRLSDTGDSIIARIWIGHAEYLTEFAYRYRVPQAERPEATFVRPLDSLLESWLTAPMIVAPDPLLARAQIHLVHAPPDVANVLRRR